MADTRRTTWFGGDMGEAMDDIEEVRTAFGFKHNTEMFRQLFPHIRGQIKRAKANGRRVMLSDITIQEEPTVELDNRKNKNSPV